VHAVDVILADRDHVFFDYQPKHTSRVVCEKFRGFSGYVQADAHAAANLFSLVASCELDALDPEDYLADVIRVMPYWPRDRYLELAPKYWARTPARLDAVEMDRPLGPVTVPPPHNAREQALTR
jgi:hypothetical protein